eukprot:m51a1_g11946 hypothetical protein (112) ;mRNA; r:745155-745594
MHTNLAEAVRAALREHDAKAMEAIARRLAERVRAGCDEVGVGVTVGTLFRDHWTTPDAGSQSVVVCLISDPLNVESKMATFVRNDTAARDQSAFFDRLYKFDASVDPSTHN